MPKREWDKFDHMTENPSSGDEISGSSQGTTAHLPRNMREGVCGALAQVVIFLSSLAIWQHAAPGELDQLSAGMENLEPWALLTALLVFYLLFAMLWGVGMVTAHLIRRLWQ